MFKEALLTSKTFLGESLVVLEGGLYEMRVVLNAEIHRSTSLDTLLVPVYFAGILTL